MSNRTTHKGKLTDSCKACELKQQRITELEKINYPLLADIAGYKEQIAELESKLERATGLLLKSAKELEDSVEEIAKLKEEIETGKKWL